MLSSDAHKLFRLIEELGVHVQWQPGPSSREFKEQVDAMLSRIESALEFGSLVAFEILPPSGGGLGGSPKQPPPPGGPAPAIQEIVFPVIEPAKLAVVVAKSAKNPGTSALEVYTHPKRQQVTLKADRAFDGTGTFSCDKPAAVKFFSAKSGGTEVKLDGKDNVFKPGASPAWATGASLSSGVTLYVEAVQPSSAVDDIHLKLSLSGGSKKTGPDATATVTSVELTLDICKDRPSPKEDPQPFSQDDKVYVGRELPVQRDGLFERAQLIIRPVKPAGFKGTLKLKALKDGVKAFRNETWSKGESALTPFAIEADKVPPAGEKLWAEASTRSKADRDTGFVLGLDGVEDEGDRVAVSGRLVVDLTFDDGPDDDPHEKYTDQVLAVLEKEGIKATFFVVGKNVKRYPDLVNRIVAKGHALGNHTYDHPNADVVKTWTTEQYADQLKRAQEAVDEVLKGNSRELIMVRVPGGYGEEPGRAGYDRFKKALKSDQHFVHWYLDSDDWRHPDPDDPSNPHKHKHLDPKMVNEAKMKNDEAILHALFVENSDKRNVYTQGGTILFHDVHPQGPRVLPKVIQRLKAEHFYIRRTDVVQGWKSGF